MTQHTKVVARHFILPRPVFFDTGSSRIKPSEARYLDGLRRQLIGVHSIGCVGYTDAVDTTAANLTLGQSRAQKVCVYLVRGTRVRVLSATRGESAPQATNATSTGRKLNRRTEIGLNY